MRLLKIFAAAAFTAGLGISAAQATVLVTDTAGPGSATDAFGQSVTTPAGGPFNNITFNFYNVAGAPTAAGILYIFNSVYGGTPNGLAGAGALAASISNAGGVYAFAPSFTLAGGHQYFFYEDTLTTITGSGIDDYAGGNAFFALTVSTAFTDAGGTQDANFTLSGVKKVPEPVTLSLFGAGLAGAALLRRRKAKKA